MNDRSLRNSLLILLIISKEKQHLFCAFLMKHLKIFQNSAERNQTADEQLCRCEEGGRCRSNSVAGHLLGGKHVPPNHAVFAGFHIRSGEIQLVESLKLNICLRAKIPILVDSRIQSLILILHALNQEKMKLEKRQTRDKIRRKKSYVKSIVPQFFFVLFISFMTAGSARGQSTAPLCEPCITVDPVEQGVPDELSGVYRSSKNTKEHQLIDKSTLTK